MRTVTVVTAIVAAVSLAGTAACSSSTSGKRQRLTRRADHPSAPVHAVGAAEFGAGASAPASSASSTHVPNEVDAVLLTPAERGDGIRQGRPQPARPAAVRAERAAGRRSGGRTPRWPTRFP